MRKLVSIILFSINWNFIVQTYLWAQENPSCQTYLLVDSEDQSHMTDQIENAPTSADTHNLTLNLNKTSPITNAKKILENVKILIQKSKDHGFITKSKFDHLMHDLNELESDLEKKTKFESFNYLMDQWAIFLDGLNQKFKTYLELRPEDQQKYFSKMKLPLIFMTSHFVTFLETSHLKFKYQILNQILKAMNSEPYDLLVYLYVFEKEVMKFFSIKEFANCQA